MSTVQQIITYADRYKTNSVSSANKILDLDHIHKEIFNKIQRLSRNYELYETTTVADQLTYSLPSNCRIENIVAVKVSNDTTITSSTEWDDYEYAGLSTFIDSGNYYGSGGDGILALTTDGEPIQTSGYSIRIFYYKNPASLTVVGDTPELDSKYHNLLKYALIQALCCQGDNPDTELADYWQRKFDEEYSFAARDLESAFNSAPVNSNQCEEWW